MDLLTIHPSASRPSLLSSFWSIHVQMQNGDTSELDLKSFSHLSLPDVCKETEPCMRASRSLTDLRNSCLNMSILEGSPREAVGEENRTKGSEKISVNVQEWLQRVEPPTVIQPDDN